MSNFMPETFATIRSMVPLYKVFYLQVETSRNKIIAVLFIQEIIIVTLNAVVQQELEDFLSSSIKAKDEFIP